MSSSSPYGGDKRYQSDDAPARDYIFQQGQNRHGPPPTPSHGHAINSNNSGQPNPYHRGTTNINRSKSLTRPERQRPRTGMINRNPSQPRHTRITGTNPMNNQPMSSNLQQQLQQQKQHHQHQHKQQQQQQQQIQVEEEVKEPKVLTNWWAWIAFLCTCCLPTYIIRVWFGKSNKNMQQAWREKVLIIKKRLFIYILKPYCLADLVLLGCCHVWYFGVYYLRS